MRCLILLLCLGWLPQVWAVKPLIRLNCPVQYGSEMFAALHQLYAEAFAELGYHLVIRHRDPAVAESEVKSGEIDGDCLRRRDFDYGAEIQRIEVPISHIYFYLWGRIDSPQLGSLARAKQQQLTIGLIDGIAISRQLINQQQFNHVVFFENYRNGYRALQEHKIDAYLVPRALVDDYRDLHPEQPPLRPLTEAITDEGYLYLNRRHQALKPRLERTLRQLLQNPKLKIHQLQRTQQLSQ